MAYERWEIVNARIRELEASLPMVQKLGEAHMNELRQRAEKAEAARDKAVEHASNLNLERAQWKLKSERIEAATIERCAQRAYTAYGESKGADNRAHAIAEAILALKPSGETATIEQFKSLLAKIAAIPLWRDRYPDGPDMTVEGINAGSADGFTPDDVRLARSIIKPSDDPVPVHRSAAGCCD